MLLCNYHLIPLSRDSHISDSPKGVFKTVSFFYLIWFHFLLISHLACVLLHIYCRILFVFGMSIMPQLDVEPHHVCAGALVWCSDWRNNVI